MKSAECNREAISVEGSPKLMFANGGAQGGGHPLSDMEQTATLGESTWAFV